MHGILLIFRALTIKTWGLQRISIYALHRSVRMTWIAIKKKESLDSCLLLSVPSDQPFCPVADIPWIKAFWVKKKITINGKSTRVDAAIK